MDLTLETSKPILGVNIFTDFLERPKTSTLQLSRHDLSLFDARLECLQWKQTTFNLNGAALTHTHCTIFVVQCVLSRPLNLKFPSISSTSTAWVFLNERSTSNIEHFIDKSPSPIMINVINYCQVGVRSQVSEFWQLAPALAFSGSAK